MNRVASTLVLGAVCGGCSVNVNCGGAAKVDHESAEEAILAQMSALGIQVSSVACPDDVLVKTGATFTCQLTAEGKHHYQLHFTITSLDKDGMAFDVTLDGGLPISARMTERKLRPYVQERFGEGSVDCGEPLRAVPADLTITCDIVAGETRLPILVRFDADLELSGADFVDRAIDIDELETGLEELVRAKTGGEAIVTCGTTRVIARPPDGVVTCDLIDGSREPRQLVVTLDEKFEIADWRYK